MGMQLASLSMGTIPAITPQDYPKESRPPLPGERTAAAEPIELSLPGSGKNQVLEQSLKQTAADLEHISNAFDRRLKFVIDHESKEITVKIIDNVTDKVIKVLPPEELQRLHSRIRESFGFLFDRMV